MKKILLTLAALLIAGGAAAWWLLRPSPPAQDTPPEAAFSVQPSGSGWILQHQDERIPLRSLRWVPTCGEGVLAAQVLTQNDEQQVHLFRDGQPLGSWRIHRPAALAEGYFRFAELRDAWLFEPGQLLLLYVHGALEPAWLACLDLAQGSLRWHLSLPGGILVPAPDSKETAAYLWGREVHRVSLTGKTPAPERIEIPTEVGSPSDLLPVGAAGFLLAHRNGLSSFQRARGWTHQPLPPGPGFPKFPGLDGRLAQVGAKRIWQPIPGTLFEVGTDGAVVQAIALGPDPTAKEAQMLRLLGADAGGALWFGVTAPVLDPPPAPSKGEPSASEDLPALPTASPPAVAAEEIEAWRQHLTQGTARVYRRQADGSLLRHDWAGLWKSHPEAAGFPLPQGDAGLRPSSGFLAIAAERRLWWLPLSAVDGTMANR